MADAMTTSANTRGLVVVTGGSGYIAAYCIAELLGDGWRVRATLRDLARVDQVRAAIRKIAPNADTIEFAPADLNSDVGWANALAGADYVLHIASPVSANPKTMMPSSGLRATERFGCSRRRAMPASSAW